MTDLALTGSCLCGAIRYRASGRLLFFNHCHCSRCRKSTGTGHASNILMKPAEVEWLQGETELRHHRLADAKRFSTSFCAECGSPMPRVYAETSVAVVPAGSLDADPGIRPERHIFVGSRAGWSCPEGALPAFETYPEKR